MDALACHQGGSYPFEEDHGLVSVGQPVHLSPLQLRLLHTFCKRALKLLRKQKRIQAVWNHTAVSDINLSRIVHVLRQRRGGGSDA